MNDKARFALRFGPYAPPTVQVGDWLKCEIRGELRVAKWSDGRIPWPQAKHPTGGGWMKIVCGDLSRAIRCESNQAVVFWFGGNTKTVSQWRSALGVQRDNDGTQELRRAWVSEMLSPEATRLGQERSLTSSARHVARPRQCKVNLQGRHPNARVWTPEEAVLLGTMSDRALAQHLDCSVTAILRARRERNIAPFFSKVWDARREHAHSVRGNEFIALHPEKLLARRTALNLPQRVVAQRTGRPAYYKRLEAGGSARVTPATLERIARALECDPDELRSGDDQ